MCLNKAGVRQAQNGKAESVKIPVSPLDVVCYWLAWLAGRREGRKRQNTSFTTECHVLLIHLVGRLKGRPKVSKYQFHHWMSCVTDWLGWPAEKAGILSVCFQLRDCCSFFGVVVKLVRENWCWSVRHQTCVTDLCRWGLRSSDKLSTGRETGSATLKSAQPANSPPLLFLKG